MPVGCACLPGHALALQCDVSPRYAPPQQQINRLWVNGPNRQFEKGLRAAQFPVFDAFGYQLVYLMEPDSVPLRRFFLDVLRGEIEERRPFSVLGSKYRGDKW
jgi:hypothetical protein